MRRTFALLLFACFAPSARADPLDDWCKTVRLPSSIAICSEPELRALTRARQTAYDEARDRLSPDQQRVLLADQNDWVKSYPAGCGISQSAPPTLPLSPATKECMAQAGRARIAYLHSYGSSSASRSSEQPTAPTSLLPGRRMVGHVTISRSRSTAPPATLSSPRPLTVSRATQPTF